MHSNQVSCHKFRVTDRADMVDRDVPSYGWVDHVLGEPPVLGGTDEKEMTSGGDREIKVNEAAHATQRSRQR